VADPLKLVEIVEAMSPHLFNADGHIELDKTWVQPLVDKYGIEDFTEALELVLAKFKTRMV
jgi:hypothetical protein